METKTFVPELNVWIRYAFETISENMAHFNSPADINDSWKKTDNSFLNILFNYTPNNINYVNIFYKPIDARSITDTKMRSRLMMRNNYITVYDSVDVGEKQNMDIIYSTEIIPGFNFNGVQVYNIFSITRGDYYMINLLRRFKNFENIITEFNSIVFENLSQKIQKLIYGYLKFELFYRRFFIYQYVNSVPQQYDTTVYVNQPIPDDPQEIQTEEYDDMVEFFENLFSGINFNTCTLLEKLYTCFLNDHIYKLFQVGEVPFTKFQPTYLEQYNPVSVYENLTTSQEFGGNINLPVGVIPVQNKIQTYVNNNKYENELDYEIIAPDNNENPYVIKYKNNKIINDINKNKRIYLILSSWSTL